MLHIRLPILNVADTALVSPGTLANVFYPFLGIRARQLKPCFLFKDYV